MARSISQVPCQVFAGFSSLLRMWLSDSTAKALGLPRPLLSSVCPVSSQDMLHTIYTTFQVAALCCCKNNSLPDCLSCVNSALVHHSMLKWFIGQCEQRSFHHNTEKHWKTFRKPCSLIPWKQNIKKWIITQDFCTILH